MTFPWKTILQGAATSVWAAVIAAAEDVGGRYCENCHVGQVVADDFPISPSSEGVRAGHVIRLFYRTERGMEVDVLLVGSVSPNNSGVGASRKGKYVKLQCCSLTPLAPIV